MDPVCTQCGKREWAASPPLRLALKGVENSALVRQVPRVQLHCILCRLHGPLEGAPEDA
jgi:hypothetical protein